MGVITRFFTGVPSGVEVRNIIGGVRGQYSGYIDQIVISQLSGSATTITTQIKYDPIVNDRVNLVYLYENAASALFVDSSISAPFDLTNYDSAPDLILYLTSDLPGVFDVRIDMQIFPAIS